MEETNPPRCKLNVWPFPERAWQTVHMDFLGPRKNRKCLIIVDLFSKWFEVYEMSSTTAERTINVLRFCFAKLGLPEHVVSNNGSSFTSVEMRKFFEKNGVRHTFSPPYHPSSNGLAVKTFKIKVKRIMNEKQNWGEALDRFFFVYRNSVHSRINETKRSSC